MSRELYNRLMSIYSGFPTRKDQTLYNSLLSKLITTLQSHLLEHLNGTMSQAKAIIYSRVIAKMKEYEQHKYLPPKFTQLLNPLCTVMRLTTATQQIVIPSQLQLDEKFISCSQRIKQSVQSLQKYKDKPRYNFQLEPQQGKSSKHGLFKQQAQKHDLSCDQKMKNIPKKAMFQSASDLKQRKLNANIFPHPQKGAEASEQQEGDEVVQNWASHHGTSKAVHGTMIAAKMKRNMRYKACQASQYTQENLCKREPLLRQEMRRKLKTEEHSRNQL